MAGEYAAPGASRCFRIVMVPLLAAVLLGACSSGSGGGDQGNANPPPVASEPLDFRDEIIYFAVTDRFANGDASNDNGDLSRSGDIADPLNPLGWHGGDFEGIRQKISQGYFQRMGFSAIWISPVLLQVPSPGTGGGVNSGFLSTGYHGYIADEFNLIEPHFGTRESFRELVREAHGAGIKVIVDMVVNHAGYGSRLVQRQPSWFRTGSQCGADEISSCLYGLPDFKQEIPEVSSFLLNHVQQLQEDIGFDGIRMDTMKHVGAPFWRAFFADGAPGNPSRVWTVGEVFSADVNQIAYYLDTLGSPSVLDFPLRGAILESIGRGGNTRALARQFAADVGYSDAGRLSTFIDNHDLPRFVTEAEALFAPDVAEERLEMALGLIYLARGIPVVYYGTEIAMRGEGDPYDIPLGNTNREDMDFDALAASSLDERLAALAAARRDYPVLAGGRQDTLYQPGSSCLPPSSDLDPAADFGDELFLRGSFDGWSQPPAPEAAFVNQGGQVYISRLEIEAGTHEFKVAAGDWSPEFGNSSEVAQVGVPITLGPAPGAENNGQVVLPERACYQFDLVASNDSAPVLTISNLGAMAQSADVLAFRRELSGEKSVVVVLNNSDFAARLDQLADEGIQVGGTFTDGEPLSEITGLAHDVAVVGGRLVGTLPPRSIQAFARP